MEARPNSWVPHHAAPSVRQESTCHRPPYHWHKGRESDRSDLNNTPIYHATRDQYHTESEQAWLLLRSPSIHSPAIAADGESEKGGRTCAGVRLGALIVAAVGLSLAVPQRVVEFCRQTND